MNSGVAAVVLAGCGGGVTFDPSELVEVDVDPCVDASWLPALSAGVHEWDGVGGHFRLTSELAGAEPAARLSVSCMPSIPAGGDALAAYGDRGNIYLLSSAFSSPASAAGCDAACATEVMAHEVGHAMGMVHELDARAVMFRFENPMNTPNDTDYGQLCALWSLGCQYAAGGLWPDPDSGRALQGDVQ